MDKFVIIAVIVVAVIIYYAIRSLISHFECLECGEHFQVSFIRFMFTPHSIGQRKVTCPKCRKSNFLTPRFGRK